MRTRVIQLDADKGLARSLAPAVRALRAGRLVGFPTETVYGVGVVASDARADRRLRELKQRPRAPFTVHLPAPSEAHRYVRDVPIRARTLMRKGWPGPVTILLPTGGRLADKALQGKALYRRICHNGVVGLRCPADPVARALLERVGKPVLATSANLTGAEPPRSAEDVLGQLDGRIDLLVDAGKTQYAKASTIVAFDGQDYRIVRPGVYDARMIRRLTSRKILFVCGGNTCRSPMAAALAEQMLAERFGCEVDRLKDYGQEVLSAGTFAGVGAAATAEAAEAAEKLGARIRKHRSTKLRNELIQAADLIFCMTRHHVETVTEMVPTAAGKTFLLDVRGDIPDPIGWDAKRYLGVAKRIRRSLRDRMKEDLL